MIRLRMPMKIAAIAALLTLSSMANAAQNPDDGLGRLFHTPAKRAVLDQLRQRNARITPDQKADAYVLNGIVRRSNGPATVWINDTAFHDRYPVAALGTQSARMFVGNGKTVELKVGDELTIVPTGAQEGGR